MATTPKFLQRMSKRSPNTSPSTPPIKTRGASMTHSNSPGGIGFLTKQYKAVTSQHPGLSTTPVKAPPPPIPIKTPTIPLEPMPTENAGATDSKTIQTYISSLRVAMNIRKNQPNPGNAHIQWCEDYQNLLMETHNVASLLVISEQGKTYAETKVKQLAGSTERVDEMAKEENEMVLEIGRLKGQLLSVTAENESNHTLLLDEKIRSNNLRQERNQARKEELKAVDVKAAKMECEKLAKRVAALETDNAILLAEKSQWLNQLESENQQLQELFEDARSSKDVMVRELNAIDEERTCFKTEREDLAIVVEKYQKEIQDMKEIVNNQQMEHKEILNEVTLKHVPKLLTIHTFETMGSAKLKFYKLQERLRRRQEKMTTVRKKKEKKLNKVECGEKL